MAEPATTVAEAELLLADPLAGGIDSALDQASKLLESLHASISDDRELGRRVGPLIGQLSGLRSRLVQMEQVDWVSVDAGRLAIGHRPSRRLMEDLAMQGATHVFTLLSEGEGAAVVRDLTTGSGLEWIWFPMLSAKAPDETRLDELRASFEQVMSGIGDGGSVYIHCSAGIHRTGMITYALLRYGGASEEEALKTLATLRSTTAEGVGDHRIAAGEVLSQRL